MRANTLLYVGVAYAVVARATLPYLDVCNEIAITVTNQSSVYYPGSTQYLDDIEHWASSSTQLSACSVEPGTAQDVAAVLKVVGAHGIPFAVKGGGHASNPGFSSTPGVHIALSRFNQVEYNAGVHTATIGAGLVWDDVYEQLEPHGVNVVGGRVSGVGLAGFILGGGYSWKSNQHGLTVDTVVAYELVTPQGAVRTVTANDTELFWALKGGGNRLGVVTRFTLKTFPQTDVWGGVVFFTGDQLPRIRNATLNFAQATDPKAQMLININVAEALPIVVINVFYDGPTPPPGIFDEFMAIPAVTKDIKTRSFLSLVQSSPTGIGVPERGIFNTVTVPEYTPEIVDAVIKEALTLGPALALVTGTLISYNIEPFLPGFLSSSPRTSDSAFPPSRAAGMPLNMYYAWPLGLTDEPFLLAARKSAERLQAVVDGAQLARYPNYAIFDTPVDQMFGGGVERLRAAALSVDPNGVMSQTGWFAL